MVSYKNARILLETYLNNILINDHEQVLYNKWSKKDHQNSSTKILHIKVGLKYYAELNKPETHYSVP
jgi:hypothetical protein